MGEENEHAQRSRSSGASRKKESHEFSEYLVVKGSIACGYMRFDGEAEQKLLIGNSPSPRAPSRPAPQGG